MGGLRLQLSQDSGGVVPGFLFEGGVVVAVEEALVDIVREKGEVAAALFELAGVDQAAIDAVNKAMEEEIAEKERLAAEAAAKKAAEAAGPSLDDIPPDEMLEHIEAIREILDFSDKEAEIRTMCEQSSIPKDLIEIAVSDPDRLDELEEAAEG